jgi:hypothetical protein
MSNKGTSDEHCSMNGKLIEVIGVTAMAYASERHHWFAGATNPPVSPQAPAPRKAGFLRRVAAAISSWAARGDDAEAFALLERSGGRLTDSVEREIMQRETHWTAFY